jgi:hypothetical protein
LRYTHSRYYKYFAKHACDFSLILLEPCNFLYETLKLLEETWWTNVITRLTRIVEVNIRSFSVTRISSKTLMFSFCAIFYVFGIPVSFSSFFPRLFCTLQCPKRVKTIEIRRINFTVFTRRTIDKITLLLWSIPSFFLINFVLKKAIVLFIFLTEKQRWSGGKHRKSKPGDRSWQITVHYCVIMHAH